MSSSEHRNQFQRVFLSVLLVILIGSTGATALAAPPDWATKQLQLRSQYVQHVNRMRQIQAANGSFCNSDVYFADDEFETPYFLPAYYYLGGDETELFAMYKDLMQWYWDTKLNGDANNGYWYNPYYDTEHTLEAVTTLGNLALMKPDDTWVQDKLYKLVNNLDAGNSVWYNTSTRHMTSTMLGTNSVDTGCPDGVDWSSNLKFADMALAYHAAYERESGGTRFLDWVADYLSGWEASMSTNQAENGYYVMPIQVTPSDGSLGACGDGWWELNGTSFASSWADGFGGIRNMRTAFVSHNLVTKKAASMAPMKQMVEQLFALSGGACPVVVYNSGTDTWSQSCDEPHLARMAVQIAATDGVEDSLDTKIDNWVGTGQIYDPSTDMNDIWEYRRTGNVSIVNQNLDNAINKMKEIWGDLSGLNTNADLIAFLDDISNPCVKSRCNNTGASCETDAECPGSFCETKVKWRGDSMRYCFATEKAATAVMLSAFGGLRPTESELPWMEVMYFKADGSVGLPAGVAALLVEADTQRKEVALYNNNGSAQTVKIQMEYVPRPIGGVLVDGVDVDTFTSTRATVTVPANTQIVVELLSIPPAPSGLAVEKN